MLFVAAVALSARAATRERVADAERQIVAAEGAAHVHGRYFANPFDAERQRRWAAERAVAAAESRERWLAEQLDGAGVEDGRQLVRRAIGAAARAHGQRLTREQVTRVVETARALWHLAHDAEGAAPAGRAA